MRSLAFPIFFSALAQTALAQPVLNGEAAGFVTVHEISATTSGCILKGAFMEIGCKPKKVIDRDSRAPARACHLALDGPDASLTIEADTNSFQDSPKSYVLPGLASHSPETAYVTEKKETYSSVKTGTDFKVGKWMGGPIEIGTVDQVSRVQVEFDPQGQIKTVYVTRQTAPLIGGQRLGKWLDRVGCRLN